MNKSNVEFKKLCQISFLTAEISTVAKSAHLLTENLFCTRTLVRAGQTLVAALFADGFYLLNHWSGDGVWLLAALAATSSLAYIGLAMQSRTINLVLLNLLAVPILFVTAYAGMSVAAGWLIVSFILHGSVTAVQLSSIDKELSNGLFFWSAFNSAMALFLLLG